MKTLCVSLLLVATATAQLGKQRAATGAKYGNPSNDALVTRYNKGDCRVQTVRNQGVVVAITYRMIEKKPSWKPRQMTLQELQLYLGHNIDAGAWEKTGPRSWKHTREGKSAVYVDEDHILYVWRDLYSDAASWNWTLEFYQKHGFDDKDKIAEFEYIRDVVCKDKEDKEDK